MMVTDEPMNLSFDIGVPEMYDVTITLNGLLDLMSQVVK